MFSFLPRFLILVMPLFCLGGCGFKPLHSSSQCLAISPIFKEKAQYPSIENELTKYFVISKEAPYSLTLRLTESTTDTVLSKEKTVQRLLRNYRLHYECLHKKTGVKIASGEISRRVPVSVSDQSDVSAFGTYTALTQQHPMLFEMMIQDLNHRLVAATAQKGS
ncbi:hypothetical protein OAN22_00360 [Alphaproteobacteria bacterium]|nr:hypothetical protein [Alphaproteobacteria bacterium]